MEASTAAATTIKIEPSWYEALADEFKSEYFNKLKSFLREEKAAGQTIYPQGRHIFQAFSLTPFEQVKVVILGQDPYHGPNQAHGLAFSVQQGVALPPSLQNIYKEIESDCGIAPARHGDLSTWAKQGVLLLNTVLTVRAHEANSHQGKGWEIFTDQVIKTLSKQRDGLIFVLWGSPAKKKKQLIDEKKHTILEAVHPSPLSAYRGFFGCQHFSKINAQLFADKKPPIDWRLAE